MSRAGVAAKDLALYGMIALPVAFAGFPLYVLAPDFYATHHGLSLGLLGVLLLAIRLFDAVQDPFIGWISDIWRSRFFSIMLGAGAALCIAIFGLFNAVFVNPAVWFALCLTLAVSAYSILSILLGAYAMRWTSDQADQTRIAGTREGFALVGLIIAVSMPAALSQLTAPEHVFKWYAAFLFVLMAVGLIGFSRLPRLASVIPPQAIEKPRFWSALRAVSGSSRRLFAVYALSMLASSIPAVLVIFFVRDRLQAENMTGLFLLLYFLSGALGIPLWRQLSLRLGKYRAWVISNILAVAGFIGAFFLGAGDIWAYGLVCAVSGVALGADLTLPPSILADDIHAAGNEHFSGSYYSVLAFLSKACLALASAMSLPILDSVGFKPGAINGATALQALSAAYALIPCVLKIASAGLLYVFFIRFNSGASHENREDHRNNRSSYHA